VTGKRVALISLMGVVALVGVACGSSSSGQPTSKHVLVCINRFLTFPVLDQVLTGIKSELPKKGWTEGTNLTYDIQNPEADDAVGHTIAQKMVNEKCDVLVGFATPGAQVFQTLTKTIPIVFVASSTPVESKLVASLDHPGANVTGVADILPITQEIDAMRAIKPSMQKVGLIFTSGDTGGENDAKIARDYLQSKGLQTIDAPITSAAEATQSTQSLIHRVDAIELPCDSTVLSGIAAIMKVAKQAKMPVFGCTGDAVKAGAIVAGAFDYTQVGVLAGDMISNILNGAKPADIPVVVPPLAGYELNLTQAKADGLTIPADIQAKATKTY
jgi:putative tryptophan/tyrosine transport system substrate-binding protein